MKAMYEIANCILEFSICKYKAKYLNKKKKKQQE